MDGSIVDVIRLKFESVYHRLIFGLAVSDVIASIGLALSTWPIPEESTHAWGAIGNLKSCEVQGFLIQLGLSTTLYTAFLSIYYVLIVKFNWRQESRQMKTFEELAHCVAVVLALGTAIASLVLDQYNDANLFCWIAPHPLDCHNSITAEDGVGTCIRGDNAWVYRMAFYFSWLWASAIIVMLGMAGATRSYGLPTIQEDGSISTNRRTDATMETSSVGGIASLPLHFGLFSDGAAS